MNGVFIEGKQVRPRLNERELDLIWSLLNSEYWQTKHSPSQKEYVKEVARLRKKLLKSLNACRTQEHQISIRQKVC